MSDLKNSSMPKPKMVLLDDDPTFGALMQQAASQLGINLDFFESLSQIGFISHLSEYDIILVDYQMDHINGIEIAAYMPSFFEDKNVILVSSTDIEKQLSQLPPYISSFIHKENGPKAILEQAWHKHLKRQDKAS